MDEPYTQPARNKRKKTSSPLTRALKVLLKHLVLAGVGFALAGIFIFMLADNVVMPLLLKSGREIPAPNLVGKPVEEAETLIENLGLRMNADSTAYNNNYPANAVSFQYPSAGTRIKPGRRIRVNVSLGPRPVEMPSVVGKSKGDAELILNRYGFSIADTYWVHSNDYVRRIVARQEPEGGSEAPENAEVVLYISDGQPETDTIMPMLIGLGLSAALDTLNTCGFIFDNIKTHEEEAPQLLPETIIDQYPDPGTDTSTDTIIDLIVSTTR